MKNKVISIIIATLLLVSASACNASASENSQVISAVTSTTSTADSSSVDSIIPTSVEGTSSSSTQITLNGSDASISGNGAQLSGNTVMITQGGTYTLTGSFTGSIVITTHPQLIKCSLF